LPCYRDGKETPRPQRAPSPAEINRRNREFWADPENQHAGAICATVAMFRDADAARMGAEAARRSRGVANSASARRNARVERDRQIHAEAKAGRTPKQIAAKVKSVAGKEALSASRVRTILAKPCP